MVTKLASGEFFFSSSLATGLTILLKLVEINICFNGKCCTGETQQLSHFYNNLFLRQNMYFKMLALFSLSSLYNWLLYVQLLASMFSFAGMPLFQINSISAFCLLLHALHDNFLSHVVWLSITGSWMLSPSYLETIKKNCCVLRNSSLTLIVTFSSFFSICLAASVDKASPLAEGYLRHRSIPSCTNSTVSVVKMTPLSFIPRAKITKYLGIIIMFFIRETTSLREVSCISGICTF